MAMEQCRQVEKTQQSDFGATGCSRHGSTQREKTRGAFRRGTDVIIQREWEHMLWQLHVPLRSPVEEFGRPHQRLCDSGDALLAGPPPLVGAARRENVGFSMIEQRKSRLEHMC